MEDLISRQAVQDYIAKYLSQFLYDDVRQAVEVIDEYIGELPPVKPQEPETGHWIRWYEQKEYDWCVEYIPHCKCSECGKEYDPHSSLFIKYCNECGAKMEESEETE